MSLEDVRQDTPASPVDFPTFQYRRCIVDKYGIKRGLVEWWVPSLNITFGRQQGGVIYAKRGREDLDARFYNEETGHLDERTAHRGRGGPTLTLAQASALERLVAAAEAWDEAWLDANDTLNDIRPISYT